METKKYKCLNCFKTYKNRSGLWKHSQTCNKNKMTPYSKSIKSINKMETTPKNTYVCEMCDYITFVKCNYDKHLLTRKHIKNGNAMETALETLDKKDKKINFFCKECGKNYKTKNGLLNHKEKCKKTTQNDEKSDTTAELLKTFMDYVKNNQEMQKEIVKSNKLIQEVLPNLGNNNNNNNSNNNIEINVFLNEQCKDAINFTDFINNIRINVEDVVKTSELGYSDGITSILMKNLLGLGIFNRPIHCTDNKRLQFFVKEENRWEKDNGEKMEKAINCVTNKQIQEIKKLENKKLINEDEKYLNVVSNVIGPVEEENKKRNAKEITKNIGKFLSLKDAMENQL